MKSSPMSAEEIRRLYTDSFPETLKLKSESDWFENYSGLIEQVRNLPSEELETPAFQTTLWETSPITGNGMCTVPMTNVIASRELSQWTASLRETRMPPDGEARLQALKAIHTELLARVKPLTSRVPWLKVARVMAAIFPRDVTCVVDHDKLRMTARAVLGEIPRGQDNIVQLNSLVLNRLAEILGPVGNTSEELTKRSIFLWELYREIVRRQGNDFPENGEIEGDRPGQETLQFLPSDRKLKGLTSISGYVDTAIKILDFVRNGATVDETREFLRSEFPTHKDNSIGMLLNVVRHQLGVIRRAGDILEPSPLGIELLETERPQILIPRLLTRVMGFDLILFLLREHSPLSKISLEEELRKHYPRWTTNFMPSNLLRWAMKVGMIELASGTETQSYRLTEAGAEWAEQVKSRPLPVDPDVDELEEGEEPAQPLPDGSFSPPQFAEIVSYFESLPYVFSKPLLARVHAALHAHPSKHFVLLSGLSGTGKTKLAQLYASAYHRIPPGKENPQFCLIPVQPEWTDATGLLGYVNPLHQTAIFMGTEFLKFLKRAVSHSMIPHFVCFDEMNLARVEYYFAPFLSAMETGGKIVIHSHESAIDTIEPSIDWPKNLYIIGTVNMDETTHSFSDKVLDRAYTLELWDIDLEEFHKKFLAANPAYPSDLFEKIKSLLSSLHAKLAGVRQNFGYRTVEEILNFVATCHRETGDAMSHEQILDQAILMKVLPKFRGQDSMELRNCLADLKSLLEPLKLNQTCAKIESMRADLELNGTTRFWK